MQTWVFALPVGKEIVIWDHEEEQYISRMITNEYANALVSDYNNAVAQWASDAPEGKSPYFAPIIKEHDMLGWRGGDILQARLSGEGDNYGVYLLVNWIDKIWSQIENDETQHVSIGTVANYTDYKGRKFDTMIKELSITENPRLKNIGKIQDTLSLRLVDAITKENKVMDEETILALDALTKRIESLEEMSAALAAKVEELSAKAEADSAEDSTEDSAPVPADAPAPDMQAEDMPTDEEKIIEQLSDDIVKSARMRAIEKLKGMRLGEIPAGKVPVAKKSDKLSQAKASGLSGMDAIIASLKS